MTEEKLQEKITDVLSEHNWAVDERLKDIEKYNKNLAKQILTLIREAGWKSDYDWECEMQHRKEMNEKGEPK